MSSACLRLAFTAKTYVSPVRPLLQDVGNLCFFAEVAAFAAYAGRSAGGAPLAGRADGLVRAQRACHAREPGSDSDHRRCRGGGLGRDLLVFPARARLTFEDAFVRVLGLNTLVYFVFGVGAWAAALFATLGVLGHAPLALTVPWLVVVPFCLLAARFVTAPSRVAHLTRSTGSLLRRGLAYAIAGTAWVREVRSAEGGRRALGASGRRSLPSRRSSCSPRRARARAGCRRVTSGACGVSSSCSPS